MSDFRFTYVYAIVPAGRGPKGGWPLGLAELPVTLLGAGPVGALISTIEGDAEHGRDTKARIEDLKAHGAVCDAALEAGPVLPLRFGTLLAGSDAVLELLVRNTADFVRALKSLDGRVEVGLRVESRPGAGTPSGAPACQITNARASERPGTAHLLSLSQAFSAGQHHPTVARLHERLRGLSADARVTSGAVPPVLLKAAYLVDRPMLADFEDAVEQGMGAGTDFSVALTGPWPPYHFAAQGLPVLSAAAA